MSQIATSAVVDVPKVDVHRRNTGTVVVAQMCIALSSMKLNYLFQVAPSFGDAVRLAGSRAADMPRRSPSHYFVFVRSLLIPPVVGHGHDHVWFSSRILKWACQELLEEETTGAEWGLVREARAGPRFVRPSEGSGMPQCWLPPYLSNTPLRVVDP